MSKSWKLSSLLVVAGVLYAGACRKPETCTSNDECTARNPRAYCSQEFGFCLTPEEVSGLDAAGAEMSPRDSGTEKDAGQVCYRDDAGMCLPPQWRAYSLGRVYSIATATVLITGEVLVTGTDSDGQTRNADLIDVETGKFTPLPNTLQSRIEPTVTLLPSGNVLVAGGTVLIAKSLSAERFIATTRTWDTTTKMLLWRWSHAATLLRDGRVLVSGGTSYEEGAAVRSAEVYEEARDKWVPVAPMTQPRRHHTLTLLRDGRVLAVGGSEFALPNTRYLATAEIYDPVADSWVSTKNEMSVARLHHTATLLPSGDVLITGGETTDGGATASVELFDPESETFSAPGQLPLPRTNHAAAALPDGRVLVAGGVGNYPLLELASTEIYSPTRGTWSAGPDEGSARQRPVLAAHPSGAVLLIGSESNGYGGFEILK